MERNVEFLYDCRVGDIVLQNLEGQVFGNAYNPPSRHVNYCKSKLVISYNPTSCLGSLGDCIVLPIGISWGAYEAEDGIVLVRFSYSVGWLFWGGTYHDGKSIRTVVRLDNATRFERSKVKAVLAILNVDFKETVSG